MIFEDSGLESFLSCLLRFSQLLRSEGMEVTPRESLDMTKAISLVGLSSGEHFHDALRTTLIKRSEDYSRFDDLFEKFWLTRTTSAVPPGRMPLPKYEIPRNTNLQNSPEIAGNGALESKIAFGGRAPGIDSLAAAPALYSPLERHNRKSFAELNAIEDRLLLKRGVKSFARAMATLPGRRYGISNGDEVDFRRTLRNNLKTGGDGLEMEFRSKKITKARIVILADISGSMDAYGDGILKLLHHFSNTIRGSTIFGFSTSVVPLNRFLQGKSLREASQLISKNVDVWSSGTRIGAALKELLSKYPGVFRSSTVFVIISDGWELGDLDLFREELRKIHSQVSEVVWLNPQKDSADYQPLAEGMRIALPFADVFAGLGLFTDKQKLAAALKSRKRPRQAMIGH
jgi:uncharacterized protein with von Willebrand factor type A (vWA) domain